ncbi:MAG: cupin domain-containing protein [Actinomycetota bacterium]
MEAIVLANGDGRVFGRPTTNGEVVVKVATEAATIFETQRVAGDALGPGRHAHPGFDETFYVVDGEWEFTAADRTIVAERGTVVHLPRGIFHSFRSTGRLDGRLIGIAVPGGIEDFFAEAARLADDDAAGTAHGIEFVDEG